MARVIEEAEEIAEERCDHCKAKIGLTILDLEGPIQDHHIQRSDDYDSYCYKDYNWKCPVCDTQNEVEIYNP